MKRITLIIMVLLFSLPLPPVSAATSAETLQSLGFAIPGDLALVSFDEIEGVSERFGITTIQQPLEEMCKAAFEVACEHSGRQVKELRPPTVIERNLTRRPALELAHGR